VITAEQFAILAAPFAPQEHEFNPRGYIYIEETAICERIERVDLSWEWRVETVNRYDPKSAIASSISHLTICGVTRSGVGSQAAEFRKDKPDVESGEIEKGSETDSLKRAARKFGIGRYLLQCPGDVKTHGPALNKWLASLKQRPAPTEAPRPSITVQEVKQQQLSSSNGAPVWWHPLLEALRPTMNKENLDRAMNTAREMFKRHELTNDSNLEFVQEYVIQVTFTSDELLEDADAQRFAAKDLD
jgi:hypothetical protein